MLKLSRPALIYSVLATASVGFAGLASLAYRGQGPPRYRLDRDSHNWGRVRPGSPVSTTFVVRNVGGEPLTFGPPKTSCGCTKPLLSRDVAPPGDRVQIEVSFNVPIRAGTVKHTVTIPTNAAGQPPVELALFATSWPGILCAPQSLDFGKTRPGGQSETTLQVYSQDGKPVRIGHVESDRTDVQVALEGQGSRALAVHRVLVKYTAGLDLGHCRGAVRIYTDREDGPVVDVPFTSEVVGSVVASPSILEIRADQIGQTVKRVVLLSAAGTDMKPKVSRLKISTPWELAGFSVRSSGTREALVELSLKFPQGEGSPSGELVLLMEQPEGLSLRVPLVIQGWTPPIPSP